MKEIRCTLYSVYKAKIKDIEEEEEREKIKVLDDSFDYPLIARFSGKLIFRECSEDDRYYEVLSINMPETIPTSLGYIEKKDISF